MKLKLLMSGVLLCSGFSVAHASLDQDYPKIRHLAQNFSAKNPTTYAKTQYPIVFAHGLFGFGSVVGVDYFYQILPDLARNGANVWQTRVSTMHSSEMRGEQALMQVEEILAITGKQKVNLIGHSHGGQTVRYIAGVIPNQVASATTIASANKGAKIADILDPILVGGVLEKPARAIFDLLVSPVITFASGLDSKTFPYDSKAALQALTTKGSLEFNQKFPGGVPSNNCGEGAYKNSTTYFYSFMGNSAFNSVIDPSDYGMGLTSALINNKGDNDGIVERCHARFGKVIRDNHKWNHLDEVNHLLGIQAMFAANPVQVYREHANRLKNQGL